MKTPLRFWFDFSSPYSYIANEWVDAVAARHGRTVQRHAILLGATFQAAELRPPTAYPLKGAYSRRDFERSARFAGLPYAPPPVFPVPTQNAARPETQRCKPRAGSATGSATAPWRNQVARPDNQARTPTAKTHQTE